MALTVKTMLGLMRIIGIQGPLYISPLIVQIGLSHTQAHNAYKLFAFYCVSIISLAIQEWFQPIDQEIIKSIRIIDITGSYWAILLPSVRKAYVRIQVYSPVWPYQIIARLIKLGVRSRKALIRKMSRGFTFPKLIIASGIVNRYMGNCNSSMT